MRKFVLETLVVLIVCCIVGCGMEKSTPYQTESSSSIVTLNETESKTEQETERPNITAKALNEAEETAVSFFETKETSSGTFITNCTSSSQIIVVPSVIEGKSIVGIYDRAFENSSASGIVLPDTITQIGEGAFANCKNLQMIDLGNNLERIGSETFYGDTILEKVIFPESLRVIDGKMFSNCERLGQIRIPATTTVLNGIGNHDSCPRAYVKTWRGSPAYVAALENSFGVLAE